MTAARDDNTSPDAFNARGQSFFPGLLGILVHEVERGRTRLSLKVEQRHMAPNGYLHAGAVVTLADTSAGYGCLASLPEGAIGFTTIELKSNHVGTARSGTIESVATAVHLGKTTQVWDAVVTHKESGKTIAHFRCTQMILYPKAGA